MVSFDTSRRARLMSALQRNKTECFEYSLPIPGVRRRGDLLVSRDFNSPYVRGAAPGFADRRLKQIPQRKLNLPRRTHSVNPSVAHAPHILIRRQELRV